MIKDPNIADIVVWGDLQAHPWQEDANAEHWKKHVLGAIDFVYAYAKQEQPDLLVFNGDLFESKRIRADIASAVYTKILEGENAFKGKTQSVFNVGNHDIYGGNFTLEPFNTLVHGCAGGIHSFGGSLVIVPHRAMLGGYPPSTLQDALRKMPSWRVAITHDDIAGSQQGHGIKTTTDGLSQDILKPSDGRHVYVFNGHYHKRHSFTRGNTTVINYGACMYHDWSDLDDTKGRGLCHITIDGMDDLDKALISWKYVDYPCPKFLSKERAEATGFRDEDFVQILGGSLPEQDQETVSHEAVKQVASFNPRKSVRAYLKSLGISTTTPKGKRLYRTGVKLLGGSDAK